MEGKYRRIGLFDHMGFGNLGDAAVHESFIQNIRERLPNAHLIAFSQNPEDTRIRHDIPSYPIRWWYPVKSVRQPSKLKAFLKRRRIPYAVFCRIRPYAREFIHWICSYRVVKSLDLLIMAGGGQLCELWHDMPYNFFKFCVLAKLSKTPLFIIGVGAGPLERPLNKFFARWSVRLADYCSFRDVESRDLLHRLGVKTEIHVTPDCAYGLDLRKWVEAKPSVDLTPKVGLNAMGFCDPRLWPRKDARAYDQYINKLAEFSSWLLTRNYKVELFTTDIALDQHAIEDLQQRLLAGVYPIEPAELTCHLALTVKELLIQMSSFDFVITTRFHGVIFSHLLEKPVIAHSYHHKIDDLMQAVGHGQYCLDIGRFDVNTLIERFELLVRERGELKSRFRKIPAAYKKEVGAEFDGLFGARTLQNSCDASLVHALANERGI